jgi:magnesium-transporting ATPase (P-type)
MSTSANSQMTITYMTMRKAIGWLGMLLPFILLFGNIIINQLDILNCEWFIKMCEGYSYAAGESFKPSISDYYYTTVGELFTGTLCAVALFLFSYKGHPLRPGDKGLSDDFMADIAAASALGVVIFPTSTDGCITDNIRSFLSSNNTGVIHFIFAALFFITLAMMSIINFRRSEDISRFGKGRHHGFYKLCGIVMLACIALIFIYAKFLQNKFAWLDSIHPIFVLEAIALLAFGFSWLDKGQVDYLYIPKKLSLVEK